MINFASLAIQDSQNYLLQFKEHKLQISCLKFIDRKIRWNKACMIEHFIWITSIFLRCVRDKHVFTNKVFKIWFSITLQNVVCQVVFIIDIGFWNWFYFICYLMNNCLQRQISTLQLKQITYSELVIFHWTIFYFIIHIHRFDSLNVHQIKSLLLRKSSLSHFLKRKTNRTIVFE